MQYVPFASDIEIPFYASLASHKINHDKLDDSARKVLGLYEIRPNDSPETSCRMQIHGNALTSDEYVAVSAFVPVHVIWSFHLFLQAMDLKIPSANGLILTCILSEYPRGSIVRKASLRMSIRSRNIKLFAPIEQRSYSRPEGL